MTIPRPPVDPSPHPPGHGTGESSTGQSSAGESSTGESNGAGRWVQTSADPAWNAGSGLIAGVLVFGGLGWLVGSWLHASWPIAVGVLVGTALAMTSLWFRYGVARPPDD